MLRNLKQVKDQHIQQNEDLKFIVDCLRKVMQRKSMSWLNHQGTDCCDDIQTNPQRKVLKTMKKKSTLGLMGKSTGNLFPTHSSVDALAGQTAKDQELYD